MRVSGSAVSPVGTPAAASAVESPASESPDHISEAGASTKKSAIDEAFFRFLTGKVRIAKTLLTRLFKHNYSTSLDKVAEFLAGQIEKGRFRKAFSFAQSIKHLDPTRVIFLRMLGTLQKIGDEKAMKSALRVALVLDKGLYHSDTLNKFVYVLLSKRMPEEAKQVIERIAKICAR